MYEAMRRLSRDIRGLTNVMPLYDHRAGRLVTPVGSLGQNQQPAKGVTEARRVYWVFELLGKDPERPFWW